MNDVRAKYVAEDTLLEFKNSLSENINFYKGDGFSEFVSHEKWNLNTEVRIDLRPLQEMLKEKGPNAEVHNSLLVWKALHNIPAILATDERLWVRLCHIECFEYCKYRWLDRSADNGELIKNVRTHLFAPTLTAYRDDNAISRLWWNAYIANQILPEDMRKALEIILKRADTRSNLIERPQTFGNINLARAILAKMIFCPEVNETETSFRKFMFSINKHGGGFLFDRMKSETCAEFVDKCWELTLD